MELKILQQLKVAMQGVGLPGPHDGRKTLPTNANGQHWKNRTVEDLKGMVWHQAQAWGSVEEIAKYHTGKNSHLHEDGVESISYTWAIRRDGQIVLCNDFEKATWSQGFKGRVGDENAEFMSCVFEGFFRDMGILDAKAGEPTYQQMLSGLVLWKTLKENWKWHTDDLYGHFDFGKSYCPGNTLKTVVLGIRANVEEEKEEEKKKEEEKAEVQIDLSGVKGRQQALQKLGYYKGSIDGLWGPGCKAALVRFQAASLLLADGLWGPKTERAIKLSLEKL